MNSNLFTFTLMIFAFSSCIEVGFRTPQPENGTEVAHIPETYLGTYTNKEGNLIVAKDYFIQGGDTSTFEDLGKTEIRLLDNRCYLNISNYDYWILVVAERKGDKLYLYNSISSNKKDIEKLTRKYDGELLFKSQFAQDRGEPDAFVFNSISRSWNKLLRDRRIFKKDIYTKVD